MLTQLLPILAITFTVFVLFFIFMGIGYMVKKEPLRGSCGRVANLMGDETCQFCGDDPNKCESLNDQKANMRDKAKELGKSAV
ncbi:(Na+)-NQR maturation NqrM [Psychrobacter sp. I-STPA6b]|uniref:(Na+)-NQR maturation NqrM n=1 Tax=Psychrobacter sp. I-STPA6b TaxID=2585718 RepID=UPI001D0C8717|nr:(Na+)-NQR maturation NqrM [Psychrobacter sp. I-STPA6b]